MNLKDLNNLRADTEGRIKAVFLICMFVLVSAGGFAQNTKSISGTVRERKAVMKLLLVPLYK